MGYFLGEIEFERKNFNADRIANGIANEIRQSDSWGFRNNITKEAYKWLESNASHLETLVEKILDNKYHLQIGKGKEYGECYIQVEFYSTN